MVAIDPKGQITKVDDAVRIDAMAKLQQALELYKLDRGYYPELNFIHTYNAGGGKGGLMTALEPYMKIDLDNKIFGPHWNSGDSEFLYRSVSGDNYQTYGMMILLLHSNKSGMEMNDGGHLAGWYELGQNPRYCKDAYDGGWWTGGSNRCIGVN